MAGLLFSFFVIFGRKIFCPFALVSGLVVALLAMVNVASHSALQRYVADQIQRLPWDVSVYQTDEVPLAESLFKEVARTPGIASAERLYFLRTVPPFTTVSQVDGVPLRTPWLSVLTATDRSLIPPSIRPEGDGLVMVMVGAKALVGQAYIDLQGHKNYTLTVQSGAHHEPPGHPTPWEVAGVSRLGEAAPQTDNPAHDHSHKAVDDESIPHSHPFRDVVAINKRIERIVRIDSTEINRWFMEQTSSPTLVPEMGIILVAPYDPMLIWAFDRVSRGFVHSHEGEDIHGSPGEYFADVLHLLRLSRDDIISGWDLPGTKTRLQTLGSAIEKKTGGLTRAAAVDNTIGVLVERMNAISRNIGLISLLVSIPLILIAGVMLASLSALLIWNVRRNLGLLRLRGASGKSIGIAVMLSIGAGGLLGGIFGAALGTIVAVYVYAGGWLSWPVLLGIQPPAYLATIVLIGLTLAVLTGWRLIRYAATVSPLEAAGRVSRAEVDTGEVRFGALQALCLLVGGIKIIGWISGVTGAELWRVSWIAEADRILDFIAFPLFVYGATTLVASRRWVLSALMAPVVWLTAGNLRRPLLSHMETRRHRAASLLLIVGLMTSLVLYPTVMMAVFNDKTERGARAQLGSDLHLTLDAMALMPPTAQTKGDLRQRVEALRPQVQPIVTKLKSLEEVADTAVIVESIVEGLYMPDRGFSGIPLYLIDDPRSHLRATYHEAAMGRGESFERLFGRLDRGQVLLSDGMAKFYKRSEDGPMPVGKDAAGVIQRAVYGGALHFLPASPLRTVNDREGFIRARLDYLNFLFGESPYLVGRIGDPALQSLDILIPRVVLAVKGRDGVAPARLRAAVLGAVGVQPLEVRDAGIETARLGSDMYIFLARQNMQIYLFGGLTLAFIGLIAVAYANTVQERRTITLLRLRGGGRSHVLRFLVPEILAPSVLGLVLGALVALAAGFGITHLIWDLRELQTIMSYLPTRLVISSHTVLIALLLIGVVCAVALFFGRVLMRHTLRQGLSDN